MRRRDAQRAAYVAELDRQVQAKKAEEARRKEAERESDRRMFPHAVPSPGPVARGGPGGPQGQWGGPGAGPSGREYSMEAQMAAAAGGGGVGSVASGPSGAFAVSQLPPPQHMMVGTPQQAQPPPRNEYREHHQEGRSSVGAYPGALLGPPAHQLGPPVSALPSPGAPPGALNSPNPARKGGFLAAASRDLQPGLTEGQARHRPRCEQQIHLTSPRRRESQNHPQAPRTRLAFGSQTHVVSHPLFLIPGSSALRTSLAARGCGGEAAAASPGP